MAETNTPNALEVADKLDHLSRNLVSDRESVQQAAELIRAQHAALADTQPNAALADGWMAVPVELIKEAIESIDDYRCGLAYGKHDRRLLGMLKAVLPAPPTLNASGEQQPWP